jgi:hypothetical protein
VRSLCARTPTYAHHSGSVPFAIVGWPHVCCEPTLSGRCPERQQYDKLVWWHGEGCAKAAIIPAQVQIAPINQPAIPTASQPPSSHPTFDCTGVNSALGSILCADRAGATADWEVDTALNALKYSLPEEARDALQRSHDDWIQGVNRTCLLPPRQPAYSPKQQQCVLNAYRARANAYHSRLRGDALAETRLSPDDRAELQTRLIDLGLLDGTADGQFGPKTRNAIRQFQEQIGEPQTKFLSAAQRVRLETPSTPSPRTESEPTTADTIDVQASRLTVAEAERQCQSNDSNLRVAGCTAIIEARGRRYSVALADAYDGRCRSYNDQDRRRRGT